MTDPKFLLVELEPGLAVSRKNGLFHNLTLLPGVVSVTDLSAISRTTLNRMLLKDTVFEPAQKPRRKRTKAA